MFVSYILLGWDNYSVAMSHKRSAPSQKQGHGGKKKKTDEDLTPLDNPSISGTCMGFNAPMPIKFTQLFRLEYHII